MNETPGAGFGGFMGWWILIIGLAVGARGGPDLQAVGLYTTLAGLVIVVFARATRPLEQRVMGGFCGLVLLMLLIIVVMLSLGGGLLVVGGGL